jgi:hypothetical protein
VPNPIMRRKGDNVVGRCSVLCAITLRGSRSVVSVGMRIGKVMKVDMVSVFCSKVKMLVIMLPLGKMVVQQWPKEREDKGIQGSNHNKPMAEHHCRGCMQ